MNCVIPWELWWRQLQKKQKQTIMLVLLPVAFFVAFISSNKEVVDHITREKSDSITVLQNTSFSICPIKTPHPATKPSYWKIWVFFFIFITPVLNLAFELSCVASTCRCSTRSACELSVCPYLIPEGVQQGLPSSGSGRFATGCLGGAILWSPLIGWSGDGPGRLQTASGGCRRCRPRPLRSCVREGWGWWCGWACCFWKGLKKGWNTASGCRCSERKR